LTKTVLVVDDSSFITEGLSSILKKNYRTIISSGGEMCLELLKKEKPDIIILDILMEPMDGWETLLRIRENPATSHIPVIMFSAKRISPFEAETQHPHIDDYITKPVNPRNLLDTIAKVLSRREASQENIERWKQAGMPAEEIEEYAQLTAGIEVDRGLYSNLQQQLSTERRVAPIEEIQRTMEMIDSRIRENTLIAGEIEQRGNALVAAGSQPGVPFADTTTESYPESPLITSSSVSGTAQCESGTEPKIPLDDRQTPPVPQDSGGTGTSGDPEHEPEPAASDPVVPCHDPGDRNRINTGTEITSSERPEQSAEQDPLPYAGNSPVPAPLSFPSYETDGAGSRIGDDTEEKFISPALPVAPLSESLLEDDPDPIPAIPARPSPPVQFPVITPMSSSTGGDHKEKRISSDTPQPGVQRSHPTVAETTWSSPHKSQTPIVTGTPPVGEMPSPARKTASSPGFFAQIIAAIRNLFSRSKH